MKTSPHGASIAEQLRADPLVVDDLLRGVEIPDSENMVQRASIGCVIPAYNEAESISSVLDSLLMQTRPPDVIHVIVNNTTDDTVEIAGTPVRIAKVEFPSGWTMAERVLYTPRTLVWVYVDVEGRSRNAPPTVLVLRPGLATKDDFMVELEHHLTREDQASRLDGFSDVVREAIKKKQAVRDMPATALEMAWGFPESKRIELVDTQRRETWSWGDGARKAVLVDGRVQEVIGAELH